MGLAHLYNTSQIHLESMFISSCSDAAAHWTEYIFFLQAKVIEESSQYEFENYMRQQLLLAEEKNTIHEAKSFLTKRPFGSIPPVRRLGHDAQPVSPLDAAILAQRFLRK